MLDMNDNLCSIIIQNILKKEGGILLDKKFESINFIL